METITAGGRRVPAPLPRTEAEQTGARDTQPPLVRRPPVPRPTTPAQEAGQAFVATVRAAAPRFAAAAGAVTAVVAEVVPPARHRQARCRVVLLGPDGAEAERVFLGPVGQPGADAALVFARAVVRWLGDGSLADGSSGMPGGDEAERPAG